MTDNVMALEEKDDGTVSGETGRESIDWDDLIDRHLTRQAVESGLSPNSVDAYSRDLRDFQQFCRDHQLAPHELDPRALMAYLEDLARREYAVASQRRRLAAVRGIIREL